MKALKKATGYVLYKIRVGLATEKIESITELLKELDKIKKDDVTLSHVLVLGKAISNLDDTWNSLCEI